PSNRIREINGQTEDINHGFGGKYVWLVPGYGTTATTAATDFEIVVQNTPNKGKDNLAEGAGGKARYLIVGKDPLAPERVTHVAFPKTIESVKGVPVGYSGMTIDIHNGRGGDFLYLCWKSEGF
ncbi:hypothetical protein P167DRAFT_483145, partial [Morchella conica CCBAS932]